MKDYLITVEIEFTCVSPEIAREHVLDGIPFGSYDCDFRIIGLREGTLPEGTGEALAAVERERERNRQAEQDGLIPVQGGFIRRVGAPATHSWESVRELEKYPSADDIETIRDIEREERQR